MSLQRSRRQKHGSRARAKCILPQIQRKYTHKQCYFRHVIPFLPVIRSKAWQLHLSNAERDRRAFPRLPMLSAIYNSWRTRGNWISVRQEKFSFLSRSLPSLSSTARSTAWNALSVSRIAPHVRKNPSFDCLHFAHGSWDQFSITWFWRNSIFNPRRETYFTSPNPRRMSRGNKCETDGRD